MTQKTELLLAYLAKATGWVPADELADQLGVSTRSVRSYVTAVRTAAGPLEVIRSSTEGYRLDRSAYGRFLADGATGGSGGTPQDRLTHIVTRLTAAPGSLDVSELAQTLYVSDSTIEADLRRVRFLAEQSGLRLARQDGSVSLSGGEAQRRAMISRIFRAESQHGAFDLSEVETAFDVGDLRGFKTDVIAMLESAGYLVNEYGLDAVMVHVAIAVDRSRRGSVADGSEDLGPQQEELIAAVSELISAHFDAVLPRGELASLAVLLTTRVGTPANQAAPTRFAAQRAGSGGAGSGGAGSGGAVSERTVLRELVRRAEEEYLVDLDDEQFLVRLSLHVGNLVARSRANSPTRNPLARSIKTSYPLTYEVAVFLASEIQRTFNIAVNEDEIAFIALHIGSFLELRTNAERLTCTVVSPRYHDIAAQLSSRLANALGAELVIEAVVERSDVDWEDIDSELIVTTIPSKLHPERVVVVSPLATPADLDRVRLAGARIRRQRRRGRIKDELLRYFEEELFFRDVEAASEEAMIRFLGARMVAARVIDEEYIAEALRREQLSSTAFTELLAVPHAMTMTAKRTAIAIVLNSSPMPWGENRVNVIALVAFSAAGRTAFQTVFEQFVEVFSDPADVRGLLRGATDFGRFIEELVHLIDN